MHARADLFFGRGADHCDRGSRATWLANMPSRPRIDLMVYYDPSPKWQMRSLGLNVKKALCYHNTKPFAWALGA